MDAAVQPRKVLLCIARDPEIRVSDIAAAWGSRSGRCTRILADLRDQDFVRLHREGSGNRYRVNRRHRLRWSPMAAWRRRSCRRAGPLTFAAKLSVWRINDRQRFLREKVIEEHVRMGTPVGSSGCPSRPTSRGVLHGARRARAARGRSACSSTAHIRRRAPTDRGYREYVDQMLETGIAAAPRPVQLEVSRLSGRRHARGHRAAVAGHPTCSPSSLAPAIDRDDQAHRACCAAATAGDGRGITRPTARRDQARVPYRGPLDSAWGLGGAAILNERARGMT